MELLHWIFLFWVLVILTAVILHKDPLILSILAIFTIGWVYHGSITKGIMTIYNALFVAGIEFWGIVIFTSLAVALSKILTDTKADYLIMKSLAKLMVNCDIAYWVLGFIMLIMSWFFYPSPATALVGTFLIPVAIRTGLPALGAAMAMNLFGHGIALSTDYIIQGAPTITAKAAGFTSPTEIVTASIPLALTMGITTAIAGYLVIRKDLRNSTPRKIEEVIKETPTDNLNRVSYIMAIVTPLAFILNIIAMFTLNLRGSAATALLSGTAIAVLTLGVFLQHGFKGLEEFTDYMRDGFVFGAKVFVPVLLIGGFFFMGDTKMAKHILDPSAVGLLGGADELFNQYLPHNKILAALSMVGVGMLGGIQGLGFSVLPLVGTVAETVDNAMFDKAILAALGQLAAIWTGGGTIIPWAVIPVAAIAGVNPIDLAKKNLLPVVIGLIATTIVAIFLL